MNDVLTWPVIVAAVMCAALVALVVILVWPWRVEATVKAVTNASSVSLAGGLELAGFSASAAAILGGPGVVAIHLWSRELWRRPFARVSVDALLTWLDELLSKPSSPRGALGRFLTRVKDWLLARTDASELPELGLRVLSDLRDISLKGELTCGFSDPAITGKAAAWLYPLAAVLAPVGVLDVSFDWSGKNRLDGGIDVSFRVVPARVALRGLVFARRHVHVLSSRMPKGTHGSEQADCS